MPSGPAEALEQPTPEPAQTLPGRRWLMALRTLTEVAVVGISLMVTLGSETRLLRG